MRSLHTFSLIKALYDQGKDYIDSFWPFLLQIMPRDRRFVAPTPAADEIKQRFGLAIPVHTVQTLAERAKRAHGYLTRQDGNYSLTDKGVTYLEKLETPRQVERRLNSLVDHAVLALGEHDPQFRSREFTEASIRSVIESNYRVFDFVVEQRVDDAPKVAPSVEQAVLEYFSRLEGAEPIHFETLRDLILGSTLAGLLKRDEITDATRGFRPTELFLDTNVLLSLLNLRFEVDCRPALELLNLLNRNSQFRLAVFDFSVAELTALLRGYDGGAIYLPNVKVKDLYASLRYRGITTGDIALLLGDLKSRLGALGIGIITTGITLDNTGYTVELPKLQQYKPDQDLPGQIHDLAAIDQVARRRGGQIRKVEDGRAFFLTEDYRLSNYAFVQRGHQAQHTVSEVMPDRLLTNLLWLKHPETFEALPIATVIAMHSRDLFIDRRVWGRFHQELARLTSSGEMPEDAAAILLYDAQVHRDLAALGPEGKNRVDRAWLLERLEKAREERDELRRRELAEQAEILAGRHESVVKDLSEKSAESLVRASERAEDLSRQLAEERAGRESQVQRLLAAEKALALRAARMLVLGAKGVFLFLVGYWVAIPLGLFLLTNWESMEGSYSILLSALPIGFFLLGWSLDPKSLWAILEAKISEALLSRRLRRLDGILGKNVPTA